MVKDYSKYIILFITLVAVQLLVLNNIQFSGYVNPFVYVLFILLLPYKISGWALLLLAFVTGLSIDAFNNTIGMHSSATLFMAFIRPYVLSRFASRENSDRTGIPNLANNGINWFIQYTILMVFIHHFALFYLEAFSFSHFFVTLGRTLLSTLFSSAVIILSQFFVFRN
ncbi:MAG: rod shape-determining protein MreD [Bacteroidales bacterium]|nr:rod shape-determining protein MreD [Bacteroidales bacterium]MBN2749662.1 rod shape-determining protein MreD [Bacteroidales bacterium]